MLFFSVGLQLAGFFILVWAAVWVEKITRGEYRQFAKHRTLYFASFVTVSVLAWPWLLLVSFNPPPFHRPVRLATGADIIIGMVLCSKRMQDQIRFLSGHIRAFTRILRCHVR